MDWTFALEMDMNITGPFREREKNTVFSTCLAKHLSKEAAITILQQTKTFELLSPMETRKLAGGKKSPMPAQTVNLLLAVQVKSVGPYNKNALETIHRKIYSISG